LVDFLDTDEDQNWWDKAEVSRHYEMMFDRHKQRIDAMLSQHNMTIALTAFRRVREGRQRTEVRFDGIAGCLRTPRGGSAKQIVIAIKDRKLSMRWMSPKEYGRLQGVGAYKIPENVIQGLFGFGDAVCVPVIQWIDRNMLTPVFEASTSRRSKRRNARSVLAS
jgi:DNA (cytosine-5)-methyltransferase 1